MQIIDGRVLADKIKDQIVKEILSLNGQRPNLAIILVGDKEDSKLYVSLKEKEAKKVGIDTHLYRFPENTSDRELLDAIDFLNKDKTIDAILVQLPLPEQIDTDGIILAMDPKKDVDGFHPDNLENLLKNTGEILNNQNLAPAINRQSPPAVTLPQRDEIIMPPVFAVVLEALNSINYELADKKVCIIANSEIFGCGLVKILKFNNAKAEAVGPDDKDLYEKTKVADVLISAVGRPHFIKKDMVKKDAVLIDIGISKENGKICGDFDFNDVDEKAGYITPVPGGVGPMTIAMAFKNTLELYKRKQRSQKVENS
jgi:methylenetetrahydrofolate dehydrogenase (NADP+) / methenyltetrahydrofolate cyclohydrolase